MAPIVRIFAANIVINRDVSDSDLGGKVDTGFSWN